MTSKEIQANKKDLLELLEKVLNDEMVEKITIVLKPNKK